MLSIAADERAALHLDELASALDAGLPLPSLGIRGEAGERAVHAALRQRGVVLSATEDTVLLAAWRAGRIGPALRSQAEQRRLRAEWHRRLLGGLAYPCGLLAMIVIASFATAPIVGHHGFAIGVLAAVTITAAAVVVLRRGLRHGGERWNRIPLLGRLAADFAEIPYLQTLQAVYGAGVPLLQAHADAMATVPNAALRQRLTVAARVLGEGRSLTEALATSVALHPETRSLLAIGERAGQLEDALQRALRHRRDVAQRTVTNTIRRATTTVYLLAMALAAALILSFWFRLYGGVRAWR
jgi:type II secretory pathway component PulF